MKCLETQVFEASYGALPPIFLMPSSLYTSLLCGKPKTRGNNYSLCIFLQFPPNFPVTKGSVFSSSVSTQNFHLYSHAGLSLIEMKARYWCSMYLVRLKLCKVADATVTVIQASNAKKVHTSDTVATRENDSTCME